jgi:hypothetical protein
MIAVKELTKEVNKIFKDPKCTGCSHLNICGVFRAIAPLMESFNGSLGRTKPFEAEEMAKICVYFTPILNPLDEGGE